MSEETFPTLGTRIWIYDTAFASSAMANLAAYQALVENQWKEFDPVEQLAEFGDQATPVNFAALKDGRTRKSKGTDDAGDLLITCAHAPANVGQIQAIAASKTKFKYPFRVELQDAASPSYTNTKVYFMGLVMSRRFGGITTNDTLKRTFMVGIDTEPLEDVSAHF